MLPWAENILGTVDNNLIIIEIYPFLSDLSNTKYCTQTSVVWELRKQKVQKTNELISPSYKRK